MIFFLFFCQLLDYYHRLLRRSVHRSDRCSGPHPPAPSPIERERCFISLINYITTTSTSYFCSAFSSSPINFWFFEKRGLCFVLPLRGSQRRPHHSHIKFISLFNIFEVTGKYCSLRKARAVLWWPSPSEKVGMRPYNIGLAFNKLSIDIGRGCITAPSLNLSRPV